MRHRLEGQQYQQTSIQYSRRHQQEPKRPLLYETVSTAWLETGPVVVNTRESAVRGSGVGECDACDWLQGETEVFASY